MSKDYIGPFGPASLKAATDAVKANRVYAVSIPDEKYLFVAPEDQAHDVLSAAVSALDQEALAVRAAAAIAEVNGYPANGPSAAPPYKMAAREGAAVIAAIFPTEGKTPNGE